MASGKNDHFCLFQLIVPITVALTKSFENVPTFVRFFKIIIDVLCAKGSKIFSKVLITQSLREEFSGFRCCHNMVYHVNT